MSAHRANPSPPAGEGAARRRRGAGEGALTRAGVRARTSSPKHQRYYISIQQAVVAGWIRPALKSCGVF